MACNIWHRNASPACNLTAIGLALAVAFGCDDGSLAPNEDQDGDSGTVALTFEPTALDLSGDRQARVSVANVGDLPVGPIQLTPDPVRTETGTETAGVRLEAVPAEIDVLNPGVAAHFTLNVVITTGPPPGTYRGALRASSDGDSLSVLNVQFRIHRSVSITGGTSAPRQGDLVTYTAEVRDSTGALVADPDLTWTLIPTSVGLLTEDGRFVGYAVDSARIVASNQDSSDTLAIGIVDRGVQDPTGFTVVGRGMETQRYTSDLWVYGDYAYTGTWSCRSFGVCGDRLIVWNIADPSTPQREDEVVVDAQVVNDVKVRADGTLAVITHEGSSDGLNGVTLLDLTDPAHPTEITRFTSGLESGVHNVWIEGDYLYVAVDGLGGGLRILDISDPANSTTAASYYAGTSILHDVYVRDGLAFLSHWNAGLVILDVGNGIAGGRPSSPVEVSRLQLDGETHNAWYWPATGYVFVGEEDFGTPGIVHVVDASDLRNPIQVATFRVVGSTPPHNFWLDEDRAILYAAWYEKGLRAVDVSGVLLGELDRQGREIADILTGVRSWAPQLHEGLVYLSDMDEGLAIVQPAF